MAYASTRNYGDGKVTYLSPYISRGALSTQQVFNHLKRLGNTWAQSEKLIQELAWRDYWQQVWVNKGDAIFKDLKHAQEPVSNYKMPSAVLNANTGIDEVDRAIKKLYDTGYMHNHMRMYVASICCNMAQSHWLEPAKWLYSHLLDGDLASNHLSWQWVAGANANKKYFANQENINRYFNSTQTGTFLDVDYEAFDHFKIPDVLKTVESVSLNTSLPDLKKPLLANEKTFIYNYYNLDPHWHADEKAQRVLLLEPSFFERHPVQAKNIKFVVALAKNIQGIKICVGEFSELLTAVDEKNICFKEHPAFRHYKGAEESRDWMTTVEGYYPSFFKFWNKAKKELKRDFT